MTSYKRQCALHCANRGVIVDRFSQHGAPALYFLTHMHADHMLGFNARRPPRGIRAICGSAATLSMFKQRAVGWRRFRVPSVVIQPGKWMRIDDVHVLAVNAHHMLGSLMYAFRSSDGYVAVYSGDFRLHAAEHKAWARQIGSAVHWLGIDASRNELQLPSIAESARELRRAALQHGTVFITAKQHGIDELVQPTGLPFSVTDDYPDASWIRQWMKSAPGKPNIVLCHRYPDPKTAFVIQPTMQWHVCKETTDTWMQQSNGRWRFLYSAHASGKEVAALTQMLKPQSVTACHVPIGKSACK